MQENGGKSRKKSAIGGTGPAPDTDLDSRRSSGYGTTCSSRVRAAYARQHGGRRMRPSYVAVPGQLQRRLAVLVHGHEAGPVLQQQ
jgi:hypothetical protein